MSYIVIGVFVLGTVALLKIVGSAQKLKIFKKYKNTWPLRLGDHFACDLYGQTLHGAIVKVKEDAKDEGVFSIELSGTLSFSQYDEFLMWLHAHQMKKRSGEWIAQKEKNNEM